MTEGRPAVAVVLATVGRPDAVARVIAQVLAQAPAASEVVVVDQSEPAVRDRTEAWIRGLDDPRTVVVHREPPGLPAARNEGIRRTSAPIVLFFDDDVTLHPGCIAAHLSRYRDPTVGGVVGRIEERRLTPNAWFTRNRVGPGDQKLSDPEIAHPVVAFQAGEYVHTLVPVRKDFPIPFTRLVNEVSAQRAFQAFVHDL